MRIVKLGMYGLAALCTTGAMLAWQGYVSSLGLTEKDKGVEARQFFSTDTLYTLPVTYRLNPQIRRNWRARPAAERTALVRELAGAAKAFVTTPGFEQTYNSWIKEHHHAVNHGIKIDDQAATRQWSQPGAMDQMKVRLAAQIADGILKSPPEGLKYMLPGDIQRWAESDEPAIKKLAPRGKAALALMATNPEQARRDYALLKSIEMGGPDNLQALGLAQADAAKQQANEEQMREQRAYDNYRLQVVLKRRLGEFVALARSVDFRAQTKDVGGRIVFVNPAYERKSRAWKQLFRIGAEPTQAAIAFAEQWLKEL